MQYERTGELIRCLRKEKHMTQNELAEKLHVSDKTISKWERGMGFPDVSLLCALAREIGTSTEQLLAEEKSERREEVNMKKAKFYVCSHCGNVSVSIGGADVICCGRKASKYEEQRADAEHELNIETVEDEHYITAKHEMTREHYISFVAFLGADRMLLIKTYPEWDLQVRIPKRHGKLIWFCSKDGLFYKNI